MNAVVDSLTWSDLSSEVVYEWSLSSSSKEADAESVESRTEWKLINLQCIQIAY